MEGDIWATDIHRAWNRGSQCGERQVPSYERAARTLQCQVYPCPVIMQPTISTSHPSHCSQRQSWSSYPLFPTSHLTLPLIFLAPSFVIRSSVSSCLSVLVFRTTLPALLIFFLLDSPGHILSLAILSQAIWIGDSEHCPQELLHYITSRVCALVSYCCWDKLPHTQWLKT